MRPKDSSYLSWILLIAALGLCLFGAATGQADDVLTKAAAVCMECIGLG